ncbi:MAG TPA: hypothetical protein VLB04_13650 [Methanotrichaceae archaeon]|nr:hypothetical protein [Methanotrichaceae archaeon]
MGNEELKRSIEAVQSLLQPLQKGEFSEKLYKVSVYLQSISKSWDACRSALQALEKEDDPEKRHKAAEAKAKGFEASLKSSLRFARMNMDAAMVHALERIARKPKVASKADEKRKAEALQRSFDRFPDPTEAMLEHYHSTSDPLDKYLVAGPWGFEYLRKRNGDLEAYYRELCEVLACRDFEAGKVVLCYKKLNQGIDDVEEQSLKLLRANGLVE